MSSTSLAFSESSLRGWIEEVLALWRVPGLALAVVRDGQVILSAGCGHRDLNRSLPVTLRTLFPIASCTKAFTALALGMLVDAGKLDWDRPVKEYMPALKLWDAFATERITARDLLTHRSGLPGHDMMWFATRFNRREIFERLRFLEPTCDLRTAFQYQNLMYMLAGLLVEEVSGATWQQFVQSRILDPLGMERTIFSTVAMQDTDDYALPYRWRGGSTDQMPFQEKMDGEHNPLAGAGGIVSCAEDMAKWLQFLLNSGRVGKQPQVSEPLIGKVVLEQIFSPHIFTADPDARQCYGYEFMSYGLGWCMRMHKGQFLAEHDGMADGFYSLVSLLPRAGLGIAVLSNGDAYYNPVQDNLVPNIVAYTLYDQLLGLETTDWNGRMRAAHDERWQALVRMAESAPAQEKPTAPPSHPIEAYLGEYAHPAYGRAEVRQEGEQLRLVLNQKLSLPLVHCYYDVFEAIFEIVGQGQKIVFSTNLEGAVHQVAMALEPRVSPIIFTRVSS